MALTKRTETNAETSSVRFFYCDQSSPPLSHSTTHRITDHPDQRIAPFFTSQLAVKQGKHGFFQHIESLAIRTRQLYGYNDSGLSALISSTHSSWKIGRFSSRGVVEGVSRLQLGCLAGRSEFGRMHELLTDGTH